MTNPIEHLDQGLIDLENKAWRSAFEHLSAAEESGSLAPGDLEKLGLAARLIGEDEKADAALAQAHQRSLDAGDPAMAARVAFWLGMNLMNRGEMAPGAGWLARAARVLDEANVDCSEGGLLLIPAGLQMLFGGNPAGSEETFRIAAEIGERFGDLDLLTLSRLGLGQSLLAEDKKQEGLSLMDEAMVAATNDRVSPLVTGIVYCAVIEECYAIFDLRRAQEWTETLSQWCRSQPDMVAFRGQCLVHRAELLQFHGSWTEALEEARLAQERSSQPSGRAAAGAAWYRLAELHRLRGEFRESEEAYRQAHTNGHLPQPGLALLHLAENDVMSAESSLRSALTEGIDQRTLPRILPAQVDISIAVGDVAGARATAERLAEIAAESHAPFLHGVAAQAIGSVGLAEGNAQAALVSLREALDRWHELDAPYEACRARVLIALACRRLGDEGGATMELDAARGGFIELGAQPDIDILDAIEGQTTAASSEGLTGREVEVLALVATGRTNREIASELVISDKTVARHVSNIFIKLDVTSRAGATAHALKHDLV